MYFDVAQIDVAIWVPPLVSFFISVMTTSGGISGAFLLLPFQMSVLGFTSPALSSTNQLYNIVAIPGGVYRYIREGRMVWPLTWIVIAGTLPGVLAGAFIRIEILPDPVKFKFFAGLVLLYIGIRLLVDLLSKKKAGDKKTAEARFYELVKNFKAKQSKGSVGGMKYLPRISVKTFNVKKLVYEFYGESFEVPTTWVFLLSLLVGIVGGAYGIGGGAILAPVFVAFFRLPIYTVAGATLMGTLITSVAGVAFYQALAPFYPSMSVAPDWLLGILFGVGGLAGTYFGAKLQKYLPASFIKWLLCLSIGFLSVKYILDFVIKII